MAVAANYDVTALSNLLHQAGITHVLLGVRDLDFILQHDRAGENYKAADFFLNQLGVTQLKRNDPEK